MKKPTSVPAVFTFSQFHPVRIVDIAGEPWFVATDVCFILAIDPTAVRKLDDDEKGLHSMQTLGGRQNLAVINESGLYTLVLRCRDATKAGSTAHRFRKWVTGEVLPSIRKHGLYVMPQRRAPSGVGGEPLTANDMANLRRAVWRVSCAGLNEECWVRATWKAVRNAVGVSTGPLTVEHLPEIGAVLQRACAVSDMVRWYCDRLTEQGVKLVAEGRNPGDLKAPARVPQRDPLKLESWNTREIQRLVERLAPIMDHHEAAEPADT